jgi:chromobox protein 1
VTDCRESAADVLKEYFEAIGGRPEPKGQKRKGRQSNAGTKSESGTPAASIKRVKAEKQWSPPPGSWEHDVDHIDNVEETTDPKTGKPGRFAYLIWKNQNKTQHSLKHVYQKCPQKVGLNESERSLHVTDLSQMLEYYENHLVFTAVGQYDPADASLNGEENDSDVSLKGY